MLALGEAKSISYLVGESVYISGMFFESLCQTAILWVITFQEEALCEV